MRGSGKSTSLSESFDIGGPCDRVGFSPDGSSFVTGFSPIDRAIAEPVNLWDTASGRKLSSPRGAFAPFAFRPDGKVLIAYTDAWRMAAIDLITERVLWTTSRLPGEWGESIDFSPDGSTVFASRHEKPGGAWLLQLDVATGQQRGEPIRGRGKLGVAPDGKTVATFISKAERRTLTFMGCPRAGGNFPGRPASRTLRNYSPAPTGSHCSARSSRAMPSI